jgi:hypothetical protein
VQFLASALFTVIKHASRLSQDPRLTQRWTTLFEEFKYDRGWRSCYFYVVFLVRSLLYVSLLFTKAS